MGAEEGLERGVAAVELVPERSPQTTVEERRQVERHEGAGEHLVVGHHRGQVLPASNRVSVQAAITEVDDADRRLQADGYLSVDGRVIYQMNDFALRLLPEGP